MAALPPVTSALVPGDRLTAAVVALPPGVSFPDPRGKIAAKAPFPREAFPETDVAAMAAPPSEDVLRFRRCVVDAGSGRAILGLSMVVVVIPQDVFSAIPRGKVTAIAALFPAAYFRTRRRNLVQLGLRFHIMVAVRLLHFLP